MEKDVGVVIIWLYLDEIETFAMFTNLRLNFVYKCIAVAMRASRISFNRWCIGNDATDALLIVNLQCTCMCCN